MKDLTCIVCPIGCNMEADGSTLLVTGNKCPRGAVYALEEISSPKRVVTATCQIQSQKPISVRRLPVKTSNACPKEKIPDLLKEIYKIKITLPVKAGDIIIADWQRIDVVATRTID